MEQKNFRFAHRADWTSEPNPLSRKTESLRAQGKEILDLTVSNPAACGFQYLNAGLLQPFQNPENLLYQPDPHGLAAARKAVCDYYRSRHGVQVEEKQVFITASTSEAYSFVFRLLADAGSVILAPKPSYPLFHFLAGLHDLKLEHYPLHPDSWTIGLKEIEAAALNARGLLLVHPNNPTGSHVSKEEREKIENISRVHGLPLIVDEVFLDYSFTPQPPSFASCGQTLTFTLSGISKILGLPQMKISWIVVSGPEELKKQALEKLEVISDTYLSAAGPGQRALPAWLAAAEKIQDEIRRRLAANLKTALELPGAMTPQGGWYALVRMPEKRTDEEWALHLLEEKQVLAHPGYLFEFEEDSFLVLSLLTPEKIFSEGISRIRQTL